MKKIKILAVGAHPDDIEFLFAGTLAKLKEMHGDSVHIFMITITNGNLGSVTLRPAELRNIRWKENIEAATLIDAYYDTCDVGDMESEFEKRRIRDILVGQVRQIVPDIVLTHSPNDIYHPDHGIASAVVSGAIFCALLPAYNPAVKTKNIKTRKEKESKTTGYNYKYKKGKSFPMPSLYYGDPFPGHDIFGNVQPPSFVADISSTIETKKQMLLKHKSQGVWLAAGHGDIDYIRTALEWNGKIGEKAKVKYAEAFLRHKNRPFNQEPRLENLLGKSAIHFPEGRAFL